MGGASVILTTYSLHLSFGGLPGRIEMARLSMDDGYGLVHRIGEEEADLIRLQHNAGHLAAKYGAGINGDPIVFDHRGFDWSMPMDDHGAEIGLGIQKKLPRAQQVVAYLVL